MTGLDARLERWVAGHRVAGLDQIFTGLSWAGELGLVWLVLAIGIALRLRRPWPVGAAVLAYAATDAVTRGLKAATDRPRPFVRYPQIEVLGHVPDSSSFPSGHAATSFACALLLGAAAPRLRPWLLALAALIGVSRVYVGVHYPLDVLGGAAVGVAVATGLRWLGAALRRSPRAPRSG